LTFWRQGWNLDPFIFIFYFVRLPQCNKYSDYCDIYLYTFCYYICCLFWRMYEMHPVLSLKSGCDSFLFSVSFLFPLSIFKLKFKPKFKSYLRVICTRKINSGIKIKFYIIYLFIFSFMQMLLKNNYISK
jgi:hypothetical protein